MKHALVTYWRYLWASPNTALGLAFGLIAFMLGARVLRKKGVLEIAGGVLPKVIAAFPFAKHFVAITLGHVILGKDLQTLEQFRAHEHVHVYQYERWGILFIPAYVIASFLAWARGGKAYRDNCFEREAYDKTADNA